MRAVLAAERCCKAVCWAYPSRQSLPEPVSHASRPALPDAQKRRAGEKGRAHIGVERMNFFPSPLVVYDGQGETAESWVCP